MDDFYTELMYIGYTLIILLYVQKAWYHHEINSSFLKLFGTVLVISGYLYLMYDKYNKKKQDDDNKDKKCYYDNQFDPVIGRILLTLYGFLSFIIPINPHLHLTDIFGIVGNMLLINKYDNYYVIAYPLLMVHYSIISGYIFKTESHDVLKGVAGICLLLYLSKKVVTYYQKYRENIDKKDKDL